MAQVLTSENMVEFIQKGSVPEFKAPEAPKTEATAGDTAEVKAGEAKVEAVKVDGDKPKTDDTRPRSEDGKFAKVDEVAKAAETKVDDDDGAELTAPIKAKIDKIIAKKHRAMKEAEEFGREEYRARAEAERRAEALQAEIDQLKGTKSAGAKPDGSDEEPRQEDFKTVGEYTRALTKYEVNRRANEARSAQAENTQKARANEAAAEFGRRQSEFMKATPDYQEVVGDTEVNVPNVAMSYMVESEYGPQLAYHLAKNPDEVTRLQKLSPTRVIAELGKLETKFEKKAEPEVAKPILRDVSKAPAPIQTLDAKSTPVNKPEHEMSFQELRAKRQQERAAKGR